MLKRTSIVIFLMASLVLAIQPRHSAQGLTTTSQETSQELATLRSTDTPDTTTVEKSKSDGNGLVGALKSPFRALGRLFGRKKTDNKLERISKKDLERFESTPAHAVTDATTIARETANDVTAVPGSSDYSMHLTKGRDLLNAGDLNGAIAELSLAASLDAKSGEPRNLLGVAYESKGLRARALESFKAAVQADKTNAQYLNNYGFLLIKNNDFDDATKYLKRAAKISPNDARIWNNLGLAQSQRGKFDDAFQSFTRAGGDFNGHMNVSAQLLSHGYAKEAIKHLEQAQALQPNSVDVLWTLANLYQQTGRISDAETARRAVVTLRTSAAVNK